MLHFFPCWSFSPLCLGAQAQAHANQEQDHDDSESGADEHVALLRPFQVAFQKQGSVPFCASPPAPCERVRAWCPRQSPEAPRSAGRGGPCRGPGLGPGFGPGFGPSCGHGEGGLVGRRGVSATPRAWPCGSRGGLDDAVREVRRHGIKGKKGIPRLRKYMCNWWRVRLVACAVKCIDLKCSAVHKGFT
jgi:hypothetical protein